MNILKKYFLTRVRSWLFYSCPSELPTSPWELSVFQTSQDRRSQALDTTNTWVFQGTHSPPAKKIFWQCEMFETPSYILWSRSVFIPFYSSFIDDKSWLNPHHSKVHVDHHGLKIFHQKYFVNMWWKSFYLLLVIDVADFLNDKTKVIIPRQRFVL